VIYNEAKTDGGVVGRRIMELRNAGLPFQPLANFLDKVKSNPAPWAIDEIWLFMQGGRLPLCSDGDFLAFKMVKADYTDCRTGTFDNSVGQVLSMPRELVDPNRYNRCSTGFHFCSRGYLSGPMSYGHIMVVKINPADVVSIPSDYNNTKGRCWTYKVVGEIGKEIQDEEMNKLVHDVWPVPVKVAEPTPAEDLQASLDEGVVEVVAGADPVDSGTVVAQIVTTPVTEPRCWLVAYADEQGVHRQTRTTAATLADVHEMIVAGKVRFRNGFGHLIDVQAADPLPPRPDHASGKGMTLKQRQQIAIDRTAAAVKARDQRKAQKVKAKKKAAKAKK
jgi:hypothetical protein